ncbi:MAG: hypothetical protein VB980_04265 [Opitutales bacterium]|jgi:anti-sigma-K factor RskA
MPKKTMTDETHYKESPHDERIEALALDIEAAKGKANKRENFWRCYAVVSAVIIFALVAWGMKEAGSLWHETLGVARLQEERAADALSQSGKQTQIITHLGEELLEYEKQIELWKRNTNQEKQKGQELAVIARDLLVSLYPSDSDIDRGKLKEWVAGFKSLQKKEAAELLIETLRDKWKFENRLTPLNHTTAEE